MDDICGEEIYFEKRLWPKLKEYSIYDDLYKGRDEWSPLFDADIPETLSSIKDLETIIPIIEERYKLVKNNDIGKCFCGQNIQDHCLIINTNTNHVCWIGNDCIERFKTKHLNRNIATRNKEIIKHINNIENAINKLHLLTTAETSTVQDVSNAIYSNDENIMNTDVSKVSKDELKEVFKICKTPNDKQIAYLKNFSVFSDAIENIEKLRVDYKSRFVTKRDGKDYIRVDTLEELNNIIQVNLKLYSKYKSYIESIDIRTLIHNQANHTLKDDYLNSIKPVDDNKQYSKDFISLSWKLVGETRNCECCSDEYYVSIPSQQNITLCKTCFIKDYLNKEIIDNLDVRVRVKDIEIVSKRYVFTNTQNNDWMDKEPLIIPVRCNRDGCKYYGQIRCNISDLTDIDFFNCWKCSFNTFVEENGYHKLINTSKQILKPLHKVLTKDYDYTFSHEATLCYCCIKCKQTEEKLIDMKLYKQKGWKVSFYTDCAKCYKRKLF